MSDTNAATGHTDAPTPAHGPTDYDTHTIHAILEQHINPAVTIDVTERDNIITVTLTAPAADNATISMAFHRDGSPQAWHIRETVLNTLAAQGTYFLNDAHLLDLARWQAFHTLMKGRRQAIIDHEPTETIGETK